MNKSQVKEYVSCTLAVVAIIAAMWLAMFF